jgi:sulfur-oxidizing protein SoxX
MRRVDGRIPAILAVLAWLATSWPSPGARAQEAAAIRVVNGEITRPLTDSPGNPARGRSIVRDLAHATCLICHAMPIPEEPDHGDIGPSLVGVGARSSEGALRLRLVDPKAINPDSIMPSYFRIDGLNRVWTPFVGRPVYTAQQVEDVVAYLASLK